MRLCTLTVLIGMLMVTGCQQASDRQGAAMQPIRIDGSSTVYPVTEAVTEEFAAENSGARITVGVSGTGGGFKKFVIGETDISNASRPILSGELEQAATNGIAFIELPVAYDGLSVVIHPENDWAREMTLEELHRIWMPESTVQKWSDVRPEWPNEPIRLYGAGHDSGTFDYFTYAVNGKEKVIRPDFTASEDDNVLVMGVAGDRFSMGFFGYAYYDQNRGRVRAVAIDNGKGNGAVYPTYETIRDGSYAPLSRPIFIYVNAARLADNETLRQYVAFYLENAGRLAREVGYISLPDDITAIAVEKFEGRITGSAFGGHQAEGTNLAEVLRASMGE